MEAPITLKEISSPCNMFSTKQQTPSSLELCSKSTHIPERLAFPLLLLRALKAMEIDTYNNLLLTD